MSADVAELEEFRRGYDAAAGSGTLGAIVVTADTIPPQALDPIWDGVAWGGKLTLLCGDPGLGKSMLTADVAARVTTGEPWPCSNERRDPADVIMLSAEDDPADTLVPRLIAAGADLKRVSFISGVNELRGDGVHKTWLSLDRHVEQLGAVLQRRNGSVRLIIIDPLSAYLGRDTDSHNEGDVRNVLSELVALAQVHRCALLAVRHLRKAESGSAQHKVIGSVAFSAAARAVYMVARDPDNEDVRLVLCGKNNLAPDTAGYRYVIKVSDDDVPFVEWSEERETRTADEVIGASADKKHAVEGAQDWLRKVLADGVPVSSKRMRDLAKEAGHAWRTVERAREQVGGIKIERDLIAGHGNTGPWQWRMTSPS